MTQFNCTWLTLECPPNTTCAVNEDNTFFCETYDGDTTITWTVSLAYVPATIRDTFIGHVLGDISPNTIIAPRKSSYALSDTHFCGISQIKNDYLVIIAGENHHESKDWLPRLLMSCEPTGVPYPTLPPGTTIPVKLIIGNE